MIWETVYLLDYNPHCHLWPWSTRSQHRSQCSCCFPRGWRPLGLYVVALALPIFTLCYSLQAPRAMHTLLLKGDWRTSNPEMNQMLIRGGSFVLLNWDLGMDGWRLWDYEVWLKLPRWCWWAGPLESQRHTMLKGYYHLAGYLHVWPGEGHWKGGTLERNMSCYSEFWASRWDTLRDDFLLPMSWLFCAASIKCPFVAPGKKGILPKSLSLPPSLPFHIKLHIVATHPTILCAAQGQRAPLHQLCATMT